MPILLGGEGSIVLGRRRDASSAKCLDLRDIAHCDQHDHHHQQPTDGMRTMPVRQVHTRAGHIRIKHLPSRSAASSTGFSRGLRKSSCYIAIPFFKPKMHVSDFMLRHILIEWIQLNSISFGNKNMKDIQTWQTLSISFMGLGYFSTKFAYFMGFFMQNFFPNLLNCSSKLVLIWVNLIWCLQTYALS